MAASVHTAHDLGANIRGRRQALGLSQAAVAARAGVSRQWLSEVEAGKATAEVGRILAILDALGLDVRLEVRGARRPTAEADQIDLDELLAQYGAP